MNRNYNLARAAMISALASISALSTTVSTQTLVRDTSGDFILSFTYDTLQISRLIQAADQVEPVVTTAIDSSGGLWNYRYRVQNGPTARRALDVLQFPCPRPDTQLRFRKPPRRVIRALVSDSVFVCEFVIASTAEDALHPGQSVDSLVVMSTRLPAVVTAKAYAFVEQPVLGSIDVHEDLSPDVQRLIDQAQGIDYQRGGGKAVSVISPVRPTESMIDPYTALGVLQSDRQDVCIHYLRWITSAVVCGSLANRISAAEEAVTQSAWTLARQHLDAFLSELDAELGVSVNGNAHALLGTNARFIRDRLPGA